MMATVQHEPTSDQDRTALAISLMRGGWAQVSPPAADGVIEVKVAGGDRYLVSPDGSYIDPNNRLVQPEEE